MKKLLTQKELKKLYRNSNKPEKNFFLVLESLTNLDNTANVFRTAEAFSVNKIFLSGITKIPPFNDKVKKISQGAENFVNWEYHENIVSLIKSFKSKKVLIILLDDTDKSIEFGKIKKIIKPYQDICFILGHEIHGVSKEIMNLADVAVYFPVFSKHGSLNISHKLSVILYSTL